MVDIVLTEHRPWGVHRWHVAFWHRTTQRFGLHRLARGPYKHVTAFGYAAAVEGWVVYEPTIRGTSIKVIPHGESFLRVMAWTRERADLVLFETRPARHTLWRPGFYCVPAIRNLIGAPSSAVTPTGLFNDILRRGGERSALGE